MEEQDPFDSQMSGDDENDDAPDTMTFESDLEIQSPSDLVIHLVCIPETH